MGRAHDRRAPAAGRRRGHVDAVLEAVVAGAPVRREVGAFRPAILRGGPRSRRPDRCGTWPVPVSLVSLGPSEPGLLRGTPRMSLVTLDLAQAQCRITWTSEDVLLHAYIDAAERHAMRFLNRNVYADSASLATAVAAVPAALATRSEERRVGKECRS